MRLAPEIVGREIVGALEPPGQKAAAEGRVPNL
jgi:hypothetical protein